MSFVGSNKDVLLRVLREKGAEIDPAARAYIDAMPDTFREWVSVPLWARIRRVTARSQVWWWGGLPLPQSEAVTGQKPPHDIGRGSRPDSPSIAICATVVCDRESHLGNVGLSFQSPTCRSWLWQKRDLDVWES